MMRSAQLALCVVGAAACNSGGGAAPAIESAPPGIDGAGLTDDALTVDAGPPLDHPASELINGQDVEAAALRGIGRLQADMTCTAFLIDVGGDPDSPAVALTSGHCVQQWADLTSAHDVLVDVVPDGAQVTFNYFHDTQSSQVTVAVARIRYSTMKGRDLAVLELDTTGGALASRGVSALPIAAAVPAGGAPIRVIGAPLLDGVESSFLRSARCTADGGTRVIEYAWYWSATARNACRDIVSGSSGSPALDAEGRVFAAINTTTRGSPPDSTCHLGSPCELDSGGAVRLADTNYAIDVTGLPRCFTADGRFDLGIAACPLDDGRQLGVEDGPWVRARPTDPGTGAPVAWGVQLRAQLGFTHVRYKIGPATTTDCRALAGYSDPAPVSAQPVAGRALPSEEGPALLCILGGAGASPTAAWQAAEHATVVVTTIDTTPPMRRPELSIIGSPDDRRVEPLFEVPEMSSYEYIVDPSVTVDCQAEGLVWQRYRRFSFPVPRTARVCIRASDAVDNLGPGWTYDFK